MEKIFISQLKEKDSVQSFFLVSDIYSGTDKNNKPYLSLSLKDKTGAINARVWENVPLVEEQIKEGDVVSVKGRIQLYQERKQMVIFSIKHVDSADVDMSDLVNEDEKDVTYLLNQLNSFIKSIDDEQIRELIEATLADDQFLSRFKKAPAAKTIHHAYRSGLVEHIVSICSMMDVIAERYTFLNRDYLLFGAIFHDIGKVWELDIDRTIVYTTRGRLNGHMEIACELIDQKSSKILGFSEEKRQLLKHIVLSHHGKLEYGSPKRPQFLEAMVVHMVDDFDSKVNCMFEFLKQELVTNEGDWSSYNKQFERYLYMPLLRERMSKKSSDGS